MTNLEQVECDAWTNLCKHLEAMGAVTKEDLKSAERHTDGERLFSYIREWGEKLVDLSVERHIYG